MVRIPLGSDLWMRVFVFVEREELAEIVPIVVMIVFVSSILRIIIPILVTIAS